MRFGHLLVLIVFVASHHRPARADEPPLISTPSATVAVGEEVTVRVTYINRTTEAATLVPPQTVSAQWVLSNEALPAEFARVEGPHVVEGRVSVPPGGFVDVEYRGPAPRQTGRARLSLPNLNATASVQIDVERPSVLAAREAPVDEPVEGVLERVGLADATDFESPDGLIEFLVNRFSAYEPVYFLVGPEDPNAKFQLSFKYRVFAPTSGVAEHVPPLADFFIAYSQTSFWDLEGDSKPFFDNSYRPAAILAFDDLETRVEQWFDTKLPHDLHFGVRFGLEHESNGRGSELVADPSAPGGVAEVNKSRSANIAFIQPTLTFGDRRDWFFTVSPRLRVYVGDLDDNPDLRDYRGHADLKMVVGKGGGLQLAAIGRLGEKGDRGSLQLDLSYPLRQRFLGNIDLYLHTQYFVGYGETLLDYDQYGDAWRLGVSIVR